VRGDGIGDALCLVPLICALRDAGHELGVLLSTVNAGAFAAGTLAHVHAVERIPWPAHGSTRESYGVAREQGRAVRYDVALVASEEPEAYRFARDVGARVRVGFVNGWEKPLKSLWTRRGLTRSIVRRASKGTVTAHEVEILFALGAGLHAEERPTREVARTRPLVANWIEMSDPRVAFQVVPKALGAGGVAAFAALARSVANHYPVVVVGADADRDAVGAIATEAGVEQRVFPRVGAWREALVRMRAVVTPDSGAAHVAGMAGVPCVDLFAPGPRVVHDVARWSPWAAPSRTLIAGPEPTGNARAVLAALRELLEDGK
jgi:ADP-heptose:LPS heptosyltransferase